MTYTKMPFPQRFWAKVEKTDYCWNWKGAKNGKYGVSGIGVRNTMQYVHRISYEMHKGPIPKGLPVDHLCGNPSCVNPDHLEVVTTRENNLRSNCPSGVNARKTHCPRGHPLVEGNLRPSQLRLKGKRNCLTCYREQSSQRMREYRVRLAHLKGIVPRKGTIGIHTKPRAY